ncbi:MAG: hypothetical protein MUF42_04645 [Cytophagaceae bacterium]|jgi:hypothetical protein|nr:hypothetical protein [Cytophagaceae bacterium]
MSVSLEIKVSEINNLAEARYCAGMGVTYIGFSCDPLRESVPMSSIQEMTGWLSGIQPVLELGDTGEVPAEASSSQYSLELPLHRIGMLSDWNGFIKLKDWTLPPLSQQILGVLTPVLNDSNWSLHVSWLQTNQEFPIFISWRGSAQGLTEFLQAHQPYGIELSGKGKANSGIFESELLAETLELLLDE